MTEATFTFSTARECQDILGARAAHLADLERLFGVQAVSRDLWLKLSGPARAVEAAEAALRGVLHARDAGLPLVGGGVPFLLRAYAEGRAADIDELLHLRVDVAPSRPPVFPRTFGQARLLKAIRAHTLTFGIGQLVQERHGAQIVGELNNLSHAFLDPLRISVQDIHVVVIDRLGKAMARNHEDDHTSQDRE